MPSLELPGRMVIRALFLLTGGLLVAVTALSDGANTCAAQDAGVLTSPAGELTSPRYPYDYPSDQRCEWLIQGLKGTRIILQFKVLSLESNDFDYVAIYDGGNMTNKRLEKFSGKMDVTKLPDIISSGPQLLVLFVSDARTGYHGFHAAYHTVGVTPFNDTGSNGDCDQLNLQGTDEAWQYEGLFLRTDQSRNSRPVYKQHGTQMDLYLHFYESEEHSFWLVGPDLNSGEGYLYGDKQDADRPYDDGIVWYEVQHKKWVISGNTQVTCIKPASRLLRGPISYFYLPEKLKFSTCGGRHIYKQIYPSCENVEPGLFPECPSANKKADLFLYYVNKEGFTGWMLGPEQCVADGWIAVHDYAVRPEDVSGRWKKRNPRGVYEDYEEFFIRIFDNWDGKHREQSDHKAIHPWEPKAPYSTSEPSSSDYTNVLLAGILGALSVLVIFVIVIGCLWINGKVPCRQQTAQLVRQSVRQRLPSRSSTDTTDSRKAVPSRNKSKVQNSSNDASELVKLRSKEQPGSLADEKVNGANDTAIPDTKDKPTSLDNKMDIENPNKDIPPEPALSTEETGDPLSNARVEVRNLPASTMDDLEVVDHLLPAVDT